MHLIIKFNPFDREWSATDNYDFMKATVLYEVPQEVMEDLLKSEQVQRYKPIEKDARRLYSDATEEQKYSYLYEGDPSTFILIRKVEA